MRILVTGSSGYIGPHLVQALRNRGHHVIGLDRVKPSSMEPHVFVHGDLLDDESLEKGFTNGIDCVAHLAAARADWGLTDEEYMRDNVRATRRLIEVGRKAEVNKWLFYSSVGVLGSSVEALDDSSPQAPKGAYGVSKADAESLFVQLGESDPSAEIMIVRPSAVYGPGNPPNTNVYRLIDAIHRRRFVMIGTGTNIKTMSYLPNLIEATLFLIDRMSAGAGKYIYVDNPTLTTRALVDYLHDALAIQAPRWHLPLPLMRLLSYPSDLLAQLLGVDLPITSARIQKFSRPTNFDRRSLDEAGFSPTFSSEEGLAVTVQWYIDTHASA